MNNNKKEIPQDEIIEFEGEMPRTIYTIGTEKTTIEQFMNAMMYYKIHCIIDIRQDPNNNTEQQYNTENLKNLLKRYKIHYRRYPALIENHIQTHTDEYKETIKKIEAAIQKGYTFCILGGKKSPKQCQRCTILGEHFHHNNYRVIHLYPKLGENTTKPYEPKELWKYYIYHEETIKTKK